MDHSMHHSAPQATGMDMPMRCKMNMLWNTDPTGICIVFSSLQVTSRASLVFYIVFLILVSMAYEYTRLYASSSDRQLRSTLRGAGGNLSAPGLAAAAGSRRASSPVDGGMASGSEEALLGERARGRWGGLVGVVKLPVSVQVWRSGIYVANVALSAFLMLVLMTYNAYLIGAVLAGAFLGHFLFQRNFDLGGGADDDGKTGGICH